MSGFRDRVTGFGNAGYTTLSPKRSTLNHNREGKSSCLKVDLHDFSDGASGKDKQVCHSLWV